MALGLRSLSRLGGVASLKGDEGVTHASMFCRASHVTVRLAQKQLGHRSTQTAQICTDVLSEDAGLAVENAPQQVVDGSRRPRYSQAVAFRRAAVRSSGTFPHCRGPALSEAPKESGVR
jgi:hypothetical protein